MGYRTLTLSTGTFDRDNTFSVDVGRKYAGFRCKLHRGYVDENDGTYYIMQCAGVLTSRQETLEEYGERYRLATTRALVHGERVKVAGDDRLFRVKVLGNYADCAVLEEVSG